MGETGPTAINLRGRAHVGVATKMQTLQGGPTPLTIRAALHEASAEDLSALSLLVSLTSSQLPHRIFLAS